jgi:hypothetical protein
LRGVIFQRDPEFDLRRNDLTRYTSRAGSPLDRTGRASPQASFVPTRPPFLIYKDLSLCLSLLSVFVCWRNVLACLFPIQTQVSDWSHIVTFEATKLFGMRHSALRIMWVQEGHRTGDLCMRRKPARKSPLNPHRRSKLVMCSAARTNVVFTNSYVDDNSCLIIE